MFSHKNIFYRLIVALLLGMTIFSGCFGSFLKEVNNITDVKSNEIVIVGRIQLDPSLAHDEQKFSGVFGMWQYKKKFLLSLNDNKRNAKSSSSGPYMNKIINAKLDQNFFVKGYKKNFYIVGGKVLLKMIVKHDNPYTATNETSIEEEWLNLKGKFKIRVKSKYKAVYIGTIRYYRDEFNSVRKVKVFDEYNKAIKQFKKKFGNKIKLYKSIAMKA